MLDHDIEALLCSEAENCKQLELRDDGSWWYCPTSPPGDKNKEKAGSREDEEDELEDPGEYSGKMKVPEPFHGRNNYQILTSYFL